MADNRYKHVALLVRSAETTHEEFVEYWQSSLVPVASGLPGVVRHATARPVDPDGSEFDGLSELYFENLDTLREALGHETAPGYEPDHPHARAARESLEDFLAVEQCRRFVGTETIESDSTDGETTGLYKHSAFLVRREGMTFEAFLDHWQNTHVPIARDIPGIERYARVVPVEPAESAFDGVAELYFEDLGALRAALGHEESRDYDPDDPNAARAREDVENFLAIQDRPRFVGTETVHADAGND